MNFFEFKFFKAIYIWIFIFLCFSFLFIQNLSHSRDFNQIRLFVPQTLNEELFKDFDKRKFDNLSLSFKTGNEFQAIGELMFNTSDVVVLNREFTKIELAPYIHQFSGDMMKSPFSTHIGYFQGEPIYLYANKRPDVSYPPNILKFIKFFLSDDDVKSFQNLKGFQALNSMQKVKELKNLDFFIPTVDQNIEQYLKNASVHGQISSVGSDGMKSLMDEWFSEFIKIHPHVSRGENWEHLGTLNGFHALMVNQTDIAPMGRELWPEEIDAINHVCKECTILELRVAHGGFNTQQRTTVQSFFVNKNNPIKSIALDQLKQIWGLNPSITKWGELGLTGEWTNRKINLFAPTLNSPNARSVQFTILNWGQWNTGINLGSTPWVSQQISLNEDAIGFGGVEDMAEGLKSIDISPSKDSPGIKISADTVDKRAYPLPRYMYIRLVLSKGKALKPQVYEFLKFVVGRYAQTFVPYSGYFPLTKEESDQELVKLKLFK
jgi:ABC-type phosphate transport system substrate-binding protein